MHALTQGTYQYWSAEQDYESKVAQNKLEWKNWEEKSKPQAQEGLEGKKAAIAKLIQELERAEKVLIDAGGKTFRQMHPKIGERTQANHQTWPQAEPEPYSTTFSFQDPSLNAVKRDGYTMMFEAAWNNDLEKIKSVTLAPWNWRNEKLLEPPLKVAIQDGNGFSPFSIAVLRGHRDLAKKIVEICATQYHKDDGLNSRQRWNMRTSMDSDDEEDDDDDEGISSITTP